jgi:hypothetical protein
MDNFFLLNEAIDIGDYDSFLTGMSELIAIEKEADDDFLKHESIYSLDIIIDLFTKKFSGQIQQAIFKFIEQLTPINGYCTDEATFVGYFPNANNAFLGIDFDELQIDNAKSITNNSSYKAYKISTLRSNITFRTLWSKSEKLFPNLILCGEVKAQISRIGNSAHFNQIIDRLESLNLAVNDWDNGDFSYKYVNKNFPLNISPESNRTMERFGNQRIFSLPNGEGTKSFELHIKTGDLRFHFYPDNNKKLIYVGYIGSHLDTVTN